MKKTRLKDVFFYFKKSAAFFDLKAKSIPPVVFLVMLALYSLNFYLMQTDSQVYSILSTEYLTSDAAAQPQVSFGAMAAGIAVMLLINIVSFVYLDAAIREAKQVEYSARDCVGAALRYFLRLSGVTILKNIILIAGLFLFIFPGIYLAIVMIFAECVILDKNASVLSGLKLSGKLTAGRRGEIFKIELFCNLIIAIFLVLILSIFSTNNLAVFQYILLFTFTICTLIELKLTAYLYAGKPETP